MKRNLALIQAILLLLIGVELYMFYDSYAKYTSEISGSAQTQVARWNFDVENREQDFVIDMLTSVDPSTLVDGNVAPGTEGKFVLHLTNATSEVGVDFAVELYFYSGDSLVPENFRFYRTSGDGLYAPVDYTREIAKSTSAPSVIRGQIEAEDGEGVYIPIYWRWLYETSNPSGDIQDTNDGHSAYVGPDELKVYVKIIAIQTRPVDNNYTHVESGESISSSNPSQTTLASVVKVGDYVEYTPTGSNYTLSSAYSGWDNDQVIPVENVVWRVINKVGNTVYIVPQDGVGVETTGNDDGHEGFSLKGKLGYVNGPTLINDICKTQYVNSNLGVTSSDVRSLTVEDVEAFATFDKEEYDSAFGTSETYTSGHFVEALPVNSTPVTTVTELTGPQTLEYTFYDTDWVDFEWNEIPGNEDELTYEDLMGVKLFWLASTCGYTYNNKYNYCLFCSIEDYICGTPNPLYTTNDDEDVETHTIKPLVTLSSNVLVDEDYDDRDGSTEEKAWVLTLGN